MVINAVAHEARAVGVVVGKRIYGTAATLKNFVS